jgi:PAS domain S-box-containing protein
MNKILEYILKNFQTPQLQDEEENRVARIIHVILLASLGILFILFISTLIARWYKSNIIVVSSFIIFLLTVFINIKGYTRVAIYIILSTALIASFIALTIGSGIHDVAIVLYPVIIVVASLLLNKRIFIFFIGVSIFSLSIISLAEIYGYIKPDYIERKDLIFELITIIVILIIEAIVIRLITNDLINSLIRVRQNEENYKRIFNNIQDIYFEVDFNNVLLEISPSIERLSLYKRNELVNKPIPLDVVNNPEFFKFISEKGEISNYEMTLKDKDDTYHNVAVNATLIKGSKNEQDKIVGSIRDITDFKKLENQLIQSQKMESIGILAGGISHDFNNLLTVILGHSEIALRKIKNTPITNDIEAIHTAGIKASKLTKQLLAFSRKQVYKPEIVDINSLINNIKKMIHRLIEEDILLEINITPDIPNIEADPGQIEQIIINLIVNARDAINSNGEIHIKDKKIGIETKFLELHHNYVEKHFDSREGSFISLAISDNGIGMDNETISHIFEPFYTTKGEGKGTGLGLSTVYGIVKQNKGFLNVNSSPGIGTTIEILWPVSDKKNILNSEKIKPQLNYYGTETILLVEDNPQVLNFAFNTIKHYNYDVIAASDGADAIDKFLKMEKPIDLLITDLIMPNINGKELAQKIHEMNPNVKVLFVSGYAKNQISKNGELEDGINLLNKPFSVPELMKKIRQILDQPLIQNRF